MRSSSLPITPTTGSFVDMLARSLAAPLPRRRLLALSGLAVAAAATGAIVSPAPPAQAKRKHKPTRRHTRRPAQHGIAVAEKAATIPPNCIYVCCDGTCDSWKMCMKCVKWPKPTTTTATMSAGALD
ncbi:MAG: hypothetical protein QM692_16880 [Thermomicrobiales bacterium]